MDYSLFRLVFFLFMQNSYLMIIIYYINILNSYYGNDTKIYSAPKYFYNTSIHLLGFPCGSVGKEFAYNVGDLGSISGLGEGNGYPLHYSVLGNPMDSIVHGVAKCQTRLSNFHFHYYSSNLFFFLIFIYLLFIWLCWFLVAVCRIFVASGSIFHCGAWASLGVALRLRSCGSQA